jgi:hypothetical protein
MVLARNHLSWRQVVAPNEKIDIWAAGRWRNTGDEYENKLGIRCLRVSRPLGSRHSLLGVARELAARRPVRFGWRTPGCSAGHRSACAAGFSISFHGTTEPSHGAVRACTSSAIQPNSDRTVQPTRGIAVASLTSIRKRRVFSAVPDNTPSREDNATC